MKTEVLKISSTKPEAAPLKRAAEVIRKGGVVVIPTDTVYGLAAGAFIREAQKHIYRLKGRSYRKPLILMPQDIRSLECMAEFSSDARKLMEKFWPGPLTLILPATPLGKIVMGGRADLGARIPDTRVIRMLLHYCDCPILTTSANPSSLPSAKSGAEAIRYFDGKVDLILDAGKAHIGKESTVVDVTRFPYVVIREGCLPKRKILECL